MCFQTPTVLGEDLVLFQQSPMLKPKPIKKWFSQFGEKKTLPGLNKSPDPNPTFGMNSDREPGLITQHRCLTSLMLLWLNRSKSLQPGNKILRKAFPEVWRLLEKCTFQLVCVSTSVSIYNVHRSFVSLLKS